MRRFTWIVVAVLLVGLASAASAQTLRMTIWSGNAQHLAMLNGFAKGFEETHPGVTVKFDVIPFGDYVQKVTLQLAGGNPPDLGWLAEASAPTFVDAGVLKNLRSTVESTPNYDYADFSQPAMGLWVRGDAIYGIPFSTSPFLVYFNKDMFKAAGLTTPDVLAKQGKWTWDVLRQDAKKIAESTPSGTYGFESVDGQGYGPRVWHTLMPIIRAYGGNAWSGTTCELDSPEATKAVQLYHDMIFKDKSAVAPGEQADFFSGRAGITITQLSRVAKLQDATFSWGIAPLPSGPAGDVAVIGQAALVAFAKAAHPQLASEFLAYMTDKQNVKTMAEFFPPARTSVLDSPAFLQSNPLVSADQMKIVADGIANGKVLPNNPNFPQIDAAARPVFDQLWHADANVGAVLKKVCDAINPLLK